MTRIFFASKTFGLGKNIVLSHKPCSLVYNYLNYIDIFREENVLILFRKSLIHIC